MLPLAFWALVTSTPLPAEPRAPASEASREIVVVVHGLVRTRYSMNPTARALEAAGFTVAKYGYPSLSAPVAELAPDLGRFLAEIDARPDVRKVHLVGHSLGNILIRWVVVHDRPAKLGRVVMLAPPNQGSHVADRFAPWLSWLAETLPDLTTAETSAARSIATPPNVEIGVIAGSRDHDVSIDESHLEGETDHVVVSSGHSFIMWHREVHDLTISFLRTGRFRE